MTDTKKEKKRLYNKAYRERNAWALKLYEHRRNNPERHAKYRMRRRAKRHGITEDQYKQMYEVQSGMYSICSIPLVLELISEGKGAHKNVACIDHNHITNTVRGLLCQQCNIGIGAFKDNIENLKAAIVYLEVDSARKQP